MVLADELIENATIDSLRRSAISHDWLDDNGKNYWEYWKVMIQEKNNTVWEATLNIANAANGEKILYDISPIKMVEGAIKSAPTTTTDTISDSAENVNTNFEKSEEKFSKREDMPEPEELYSDGEVAYEYFCAKGAEHPLFLFFYHNLGNQCFYFSVEIFFSANQR